MREIESLEISWEDLFSVYGAACNVKFAIQETGSVYLNSQYYKSSLCTVISKQFSKEKENTVNHVVKLILTGWDKHSGEYLYPIPSTKHYSVNPDKTMAQDAALAYLVQSRDLSYWKGEQGIIRMEALDFLVNRLKSILDLTGDVYTLINYVHPDCKHSKHSVIVDNWLRDGIA